MKPRFLFSPTLLIISGLVVSQALVAGTDFEVATRLERLERQAVLRADPPVSLQDRSGPSTVVPSELTQDLSEIVPRAQLHVGDPRLLAQSR